MLSIFMILKLLLLFGITFFGTLSIGIIGAADSVTENIVVNDQHHPNAYRMHHQIIDNDQKFQQIHDSIYFHHSRLAKRNAIFQNASVIWDEPIPNYNRTHLDLKIRYIETLVFVDPKIIRNYSYNIALAKQDIMRTIKATNLYFYQLNIRLLIVDIIELEQTSSSLNLQTFETYRNNRMYRLPHHDFAILMCYRYAGGMAFINGMCNYKSVALCGFYPQNPEAMAGIFFHEVAHLIGVAHMNANDTLNIDNCNCSVDERNTTNCLRIPGFDHSCTVQQLVNLLPSVYCIDQLPDYLPSTVVSICGNGIREGDEQCDCGPTHDDCRNQWNCRYDSCTQIIRDFYRNIVIIVVSIIFIIIIIFSSMAHRRSSSATSDFSFVKLMKLVNDYLRKPMMLIFSSSWSLLNRRRPILLKRLTLATSRPSEQALIAIDINSAPIDHQCVHMYIDESIDNDYQVNKSSTIANV